MNTTLQYLIHDPEQPADACVVWLHGLGADGHDFEPIVPELNLPPAHRIRFVFPHAPIQPVTINGGMEMRAWYDIRDTGLERSVDEAGIRASADAVNALLDMQRHDGIAANRIVLAGFSQGGAIALHLGLRYPQRLAGIIALSTYLPLQARFDDEATAAQRSTPIFIGHGQFDPLVSEQHGKNTHEFLKARGYSADYHAYPMEHAVCAPEIEAIGTWLRHALAQD